MSDVTSPAAQNLDFDDETLRAIAEVYSMEGDNECSKGEYHQAIDSYTEGIKVNCKDENLNAKLFTNRATVHYHLGNYSESLRDAKVARQFQPTYMEAIIRGALACVKLNLMKDAIKLCDEGLATDKENKTLLELKSMFSKTEKTIRDKIKTNSETGAVEDKLDDKKNLLKTEQSLQGEEVLKEKGKAIESFEDDILNEKAEEYKNLGNNEFRKKEYATARELYSKGINVNCKDQELNGKLYSNRATAHFYLGNYLDSLNDAKAAIQIQPAYIKAIERGAQACLKLKMFQDAIAWCDRGLATDTENKRLLQLKDMSLKSEITCKETAESSVNTNIKEEPRERLDKEKRQMGNSIENYHLMLSIAKEVGDKAAESFAYSNLGNAYHSLADFKKSLDYHQLHLSTAKEVGDKFGMGTALGNIGIAYCNVGNFKRAMECHQQHLGIAKELGDRAREGRVHCNLGNAYRNMGDFEAATRCHQLHLKIAKELGDRVEEGRAYSNLGNICGDLGDFRKSIEYQELYLRIVKEHGDKAGEQIAYGNLGVAYCKRGDFKKAIEYFQLTLSIAKGLEDRVREGSTYNNLGNTYCKLGDFKKAEEYHQLGLHIAKELGNRAKEGDGYANLGIDYCSLGDSKTALTYHHLALAIAKEVGDVAAEGRECSNLGTAYWYQSDFKTAIEYHQLHLNIVKGQGDKAGEGRAYNNLGNALNSLGEFQQAINYYQKCLAIAKEVEDRAEEGHVNGNIGYAYFNMGKYGEAIEYYKKDLEIAREVGDRAEEGGAFSNLGIAYKSLGKFPEAIEYHKLHLSIAREVGDKAGEGCAYGNLANVYYFLDDPEKALEYHHLELTIAREVGNKVGEGISYFNQGHTHFFLGNLGLSEICLKSSVELFDHVRGLLRSKDEWKISLRDRYQEAYTFLWMVLLQQNKIEDALYVAERGRGQALMDLMESRYNLRSTQCDSGMQIEQVSDVASCIASPTVFLAVDKTAVNFWVLQKGKEYKFLRKTIDAKYFKEDAMASLKSLNENAYSTIGVLKSVQCEDRSFDEPIDEPLPHQMSDKKEPPSGDYKEDPLKLLYDILVSPVVDLLHSGDVTIVPDGPLFLAPFTAFMDQNSSYLFEKFTLRIIPTLATLKIMAELSERHQSTSGVLLVGDPCLRSIRIKGKAPNQLPNAKKEVEMIGEILKTVPLTEEKATKAEVLSRLSSVALVHIAAHGKAETGEILLSPNPTTYKRPKEKDYLLTMEDVKNAKLNAQLVVLSCCHSGRGEINAEGVVGIARAFLGAGARSVLASLWAIDDAATLTFMEYFYKQLVEEKQRASKSLNQAMKLMRESKNFSEVRLWAPFVLIGDDVSLDLGQNLTPESQPSKEDSST